MPRKKTIIKEVEKIEEEITPKESVIASKKDISDPVETDTSGKAEFRVFLKKYRAKNPIKYEQKKADFERQLRGDVEVSFNSQSKTRTFTFRNTPPRESK